MSHTMQPAEFNTMVLDFGFVWIQKIKNLLLVLNVEVNK